MQLHTPISVNTLKLRNTGSYTVVWIHENTAHAVVLYPSNVDRISLKGKLSTKKNQKNKNAVINKWNEQ